VQKCDKPRNHFVTSRDLPWNNPDEWPNPALGGLLKGTGQTCFPKGGVDGQSVTLEVARNRCGSRIGLAKWLIRMQASGMRPDGKS